MALTDQPYLPLYVDDWMNNTKLKLCSSGAHGLMISIMCLMHKSENYGIILLKQKFKQTDKQNKNFALQIAKVTSFDLLEIEKYFDELIEENVLKIDGENLICERMVKDADISIKRASSGKQGAKNKKYFAKDFVIANVLANTGIENENENVIVIDKEKGVSGEKTQSRNRAFYQKAISSDQWIETVCMQQKSNPDLIKTKLHEFFLLLEAQTDQKINEKEFRSHFVSWMTKNANLKPKSNVNNESPSDRNR